MKDSMLYGLTYDYTENELGGIDLLFFQEPPLQNSDLARIPVKMMEFNDIPGLLPLHFEETDLQVQLRYDITGKRKLSQVIRVNPLTLSSFYQLLLEIAGILTESGNYMLSPDGYVLLDDFIFVGRDYEEVQLVYLPVAHLRQNPTVQEGIRTLVTGLLASLEDLSDRGIQQLLQYLHSPNFSVIGLKNQILALIVNRSDVVKTENEFNVNVVSGASAVFHKSSAPFHLSPSIVPKSSAALSAFSSLGIFCALLLTAASWIGFVIFPLEGLLYIAIGTSILCGDGLFIAHRLEMIPRLTMLTRKFTASVRLTADKVSLPRLTASHIETDVESGSKPDSRAEKGAQTDDQIKAHTQVQPQDQTEASNTSNQDGIPFVRDKSFSQTAAKLPIVLGQAVSKIPPAHTVLLNSPSSRSNIFGTPLLEIKRGPTVETIEMQNERFVIGRGPAAVDYAENTPGVSRTHVEFIFNEDGRWVKDLASLNGTYLNEERLASYKLYPLKNGDRIRMLSSIFIFRLP